MLMHEYAPWRSKYYNNKIDSCPFCDKDEALIIFRAKYCFGMMNLYPYTLGAFMIIPYEHIDNVENLSEEYWNEISKFVKIGVKILKQDLKADGVNIGMNLGIAAGAGIAQHIHYHLVPRWERDTNFITTIGQTRIHGAVIEDQVKILKDGFKKEMSL